MTKRNLIRKILDTKLQSPEHVRLDIEPKIAGTSLLHDQFGIPKVSKHEKKDIPIMDSISNEPVSIKATNSDDGFIPPKNNFVNVGNNEEHTWYSEKVAGPSMIDNNEVVDVDALQGIDPLPEVKQISKKAASTVFSSFKDRIDKAYEIIKNDISKIDNLDKLYHYRDSLYSGFVKKVLDSYLKLPEAEKPAVGEIINELLEFLTSEVKYKELDLGGESEDSESEENTEKEEQESEEYEDTEDPEDTEEDESSFIEDLKEGEYAIIIDDSEFTVVDSEAGVKEVLTRMVLGNDVDLARVKVIKRIKIDFGITIA